MRYKEQSNVNLLLYSFVLSMFIIAQMIELSFPPWTLLYKWYFKILLQLNSLIHQVFTEAVPGFVPDAGDTVMSKDRHCSYPHKVYTWGKVRASVQHSCQVRDTPHMALAVKDRYVTMEPLRVEKASPRTALADVLSSVTEITTCALLREPRARCRTASACTGRCLLILRKVLRRPAAALRSTNLKVSNPEGRSELC